jgi:hypothetical protein
MEQILHPIRKPLGLRVLQIQAAVAVVGFLQLVMVLRVALELSSFVTLHHNKHLLLQQETLR